MIGKLLLSLVTLLFAGLSGMAALIQAKQKGVCTADVLMLVGASALLVAIVLKWAAPLWTAVLTSAVGAGLICASAILNGRRGGKIHWQHHAVRLCVAALVVSGMALL